ncbi:esterase [Mycobacterium paraense]|uniref:Esterase n=1 Tax=Mycobacterium paraense TaxID=767916 RepID=A0A1X2AGU5_9MYCO|nr:prolyl oligopeptidase family serine peptidase [Mycobacterium paraense]MCV7444597.1 prolyl oligopeptidase family serine peptidase [Mycobacterium paraense]ORW33730.1 esterase [Mycobacterium paraense]ORW41958.1 esterase [Mycobacterium paraense]ORW44808.1 esterase [Mycobacterium paraense]ORW50587.1 esterase [Mycobacterium paraense]
MPYARWLTLAVLTALAVSVAGCGERHVAAAAAQDLSATLRSGGMDRTYTLHVPPGDPVGLVLSLHGGGGTGTGQRGLTDFDTVADANHLLVAYPDGYDKSWADGRGASPADRHHVDDVGFLVALAGKLRSDYNIAPGHVFATGMSNGGFMTNRLACDRADVFAAIAPVAGTLGTGVACHPSRPVSVLAAHGTADPLVPFNGGDVRGRGGVSHSVAANSMVNAWRSVDGCQGDPSQQVLPNVGDGTVVHRYDAAPCAASTEVVFYQIDNGGHTWPGGKQYLPQAIIGRTSRALDASEVIAQFFLAHARD